MKLTSKIYYANSHSGKEFVQCYGYHTNINVNNLLDYFIKKVKSKKTIEYHQITQSKIIKSRNSSHFCLIRL